MKTIFITGASSGIGKATAKLFQKKGWNVVATMRNPEKETELANIKNILLAKCDVTDKNSIIIAIKKGIEYFGKIDVLVNNAGYYGIGPAELASSEEIKRIIDTNLIGLMEVTRLMIPHFREKKSGTIINISSIAGIISVPLQSIYHATKWGVEGFSESLQYELMPFNIKVKIIEPGVIKTDFYNRSMTVFGDSKENDYNDYSKNIIANLIKNGNNGSSSEDVAKTIYKAATNSCDKLRFPTGKSKEAIFMRKILPQRIFSSIMEKSMSK
ncbi:SDR family oxidoreductase [Fusobacterium sp. PH5-44]|uniref:SDR family oxidoreductase n=1 Tax=unclassified Fusobacterium TaxID=2648384 RepID=UPI003D1FCECA